MSYPELRELDEPLTPEELLVLQRQLESESPQTNSSKFNYAWGLIKSKTNKQTHLGIDLLVELYRLDYNRRDCLYYLTLGSFKLGEYSASRKYIDKLLELEPKNSQAHQLKLTIELKITNDGLIGLGIGAGVLAVSVGLIAGILGKKRR